MTMKATYCLLNPQGQIAFRKEHDPETDVWNIDTGWSLRLASECTGLPDAPPSPPKLMPVTKLVLMRRLGERWPTLKAVLQQMPETVRDSWDLAQEIDPADGLFNARKAALQAALGLSDSEFNALFAP